MKEFIVKAKIVNLQELEEVVKEIQKIEKERSCNCTLLEIEIR